MELLVKNIKNNKYFYLKDEWYIPCDNEDDISYNKKFVEKSDDFSKINVSDIVEEGEEIYYINVDTSLLYVTNADTAFSNPSPNKLTP